MNTFNDTLKILISEAYSHNINEDEKEKLFKISKYHADKFEFTCKTRGFPFEKSDILLTLYESIIKAQKSWKPGKCHISTYVSKILQNNILNIYRKYNREIINKYKNKFSERYYDILEDQCIWANESEIYKNSYINQFINSQEERDKIVYRKIIKGFTRKEIYESKISTRKNVYNCWEKLTLFLKNNLI
ncbi:hypothetical protein [Spiroplasma endosymbiont of Aspidapion aeneum]|uniref:hypothetical protein n=1 Tax=Spiroplasma endosymbiont of Aspidapion aeneum TaxID=3066276 RepID=UPI00313CE255